MPAVRPFAAARSSIAALKNVRTPVFLMQGRRDFAFGLDQAKRAYAALRGPKQLWIGLHGHAPSSGIAADTPAMRAARSVFRIETNMNITFPPRKNLKIPVRLPPNAGEGSRTPTPCGTGT